MIDLNNSQNGLTQRHRNRAILRASLSADHRITGHSAHHRITTARPEFRRVKLRCGRIDHDRSGLQHLDITGLADIASLIDGLREIGPIQQRLREGDGVGARTAGGGRFGHGVACRGHGLRSRRWGVSTARDRGRRMGVKNDLRPRLGGEGQRGGGVRGQAIRAALCKPWSAAVIGHGSDDRHGRGGAVHRELHGFQGIVNRRGTDVASQIGGGDGVQAIDQVLGDADRVAAVSECGSVFLHGKTARQFDRRATRHFSLDADHCAALRGECERRAWAAGQPVKTSTGQAGLQGVWLNHQPSWHARSLRVQPNGHRCAEGDIACRIGDARSKLKRSIGGGRHVCRCCARRTQRHPGSRGRIA